MNFMTKRLLFAAAFFIAAAGLLVPQMLYIVNEWDQAIVTMFGHYQRTEKQPGLKFKVPFVERVNRFDRRILDSDAVPGEYLTKDKKRLLADHVIRWRIEDPFLFFKTVHDEFGAARRLDDIVYSEMRRVLAENDFSEIIAAKRESLMELIASKAQEQAKQFGIFVVDVRIKRADLPTEVQASVYARMMAERERIAKRYRSEGEEEAQKIRSQTDKDKTIMLAEVYEQAQKMRGGGDREAAKIYAEAYTVDPEFYRFTKSLETYEAALQDGATFFLSSDSEFLKYFKKTEVR